MTSEIRTFASGATRNVDNNKLDYEGFLSPLVLEAFAKYMHRHRKQADGSMRASDNWQKGMGKDVYIKSLFRHFHDLWLLHRGHQPRSPETGEPVVIEDAIAACLFNLQGYLHEHLQPEKYASNATETPPPSDVAIKHCRTCQTSTGHRKGYCVHCGTQEGSTPAAKAGQQTEAVPHVACRHCGSLCKEATICQYCGKFNPM